MNTRFSNLHRKYNGYLHVNLNIIDFLGETPVRQQFSIPTDLVDISPHERLIKRFRQNNPPVEFSGLSDVNLYF